MIRNTMFGISLLALSAGSAFAAPVKHHGRQDAGRRPGRHRGARGRRRQARQEEQEEQEGDKGDATKTEGAKEMNGEVIRFQACHEPRQCGRRAQQQRRPRGVCARRARLGGDAPPAPGPTRSRSARDQYRKVMCRVPSGVSSRRQAVRAIERQHVHQDRRPCTCTRKPA